MQKFVVESQGDSKEVIRERPFTICGIGSYKPHHKWTLIAGGGIELEPEENLGLIRAGVEYGIELPERWELSFSFEYDHKFETYDTWIFGIGFGKVLSKKESD